MRRVFEQAQQQDGPNLPTAHHLCLMIPTSNKAATVTAASWIVLKTGYASSNHRDQQTADWPFGVLLPNLNLYFLIKVQHTA